MKEIKLPMNLREAVQEAIRELECAAIEAALEQTEGRVKEAAKLLGMKPDKLFHLRKRHGFLIHTGGAQAGAKDW